MKNAMIQKIEIVPVDLPLKSPFITALGRKTATHNVFVILRLSDGTTGYGEASSSLAIPSATQEAMTRELIALAQQLEGKPFADAVAFIEQGLPEETQPTSFSALEMAIYDAKARQKGISLHQVFGKKNVPLETCFTISAWPVDMSKRTARAEWKNGFRTFKIKVGKEWSSDLKRVIAVHEAVPEAKIILDGNQGFSVPGVLEFANEVKKRGITIDFMEQPLPKDSSWEEWVLVKEEMGIPLALDESISTFKDAKEYIRRGVVDIINIKLAKSGIGEALRIIKLAQEKGIKLMIGCMAESVVGLTTSVHLAAGTGVFSFVDLDSAYLLKPAKNLTGGYLQEGPKLKVPVRVKGSGVSISGSRKKEKVSV